ncbi:MAG: hypothetical protein M3220_13825 [Chloroflexota bacterium]|nr:hypothetical protein [Chloroflexota bacterium]
MDGRQIALGFITGVIATIVMSVPIIIDALAGLSPIPQPIPLVVVKTTLGARTHEALLLGVTTVAHLSYGGFWGAVLAVLAHPITIWKGVALGIFVWLVQQVVFLPYIGWGLFGTAITVAIAAVTFLNHMVYCLTSSWLLGRKEVLERLLPVD